MMMMMRSCCILYLFCGQWAQAGFLILLNQCCCSFCRGNMGKKACTHVMSDCKLATTGESLSTDGRKRHERKVFLWIVRTLRRNMHHVWAIQDVLLADPSKNKNGAKPLNRSVVYIIANNPKSFLRNACSRTTLRAGSSSLRPMHRCYVSSPPSS